MKKVESTNLRLHGICVVGRLPKDTDAHGKRFPCTERYTLALDCILDEIILTYLAAGQSTDTISARRLAECAKSSYSTLLLIRL